MEFLQHYGIPSSAGYHDRLGRHLQAVGQTEAALEAMLLLPNLELGARPGQSWIFGALHNFDDWMLMIWMIGVFQS